MQCIRSIGSYVTLAFFSAVLLWQGIDGTLHLIESLQPSHCHHQYQGDQKQITHYHHVEKQCAVCHFSFGDFAEFSFRSPSPASMVSSGFYSRIESLEIVSFFRGSRFAHRGPPVL